MAGPTGFPAMRGVGFESPGLVVTHLFLAGKQPSVVVVAGLWRYGEQSWQSANEPRNWSVGLFRKTYIYIYILKQGGVWCMSLS